MVIKFESRKYPKARILSVLSYLFNLIAVIFLYGGTGIFLYQMFHVLFGDESFTWGILWFFPGGFIIALLISLIGDFVTDSIFKLKIKFSKNQFLIKDENYKTSVHPFDNRGENNENTRE